MKKRNAVIIKEVIVNQVYNQVFTYLKGGPYTTPIVQRLPAWDNKTIQEVIKNLMYKFNNSQESNLGTIYIYKNIDKKGNQVTYIYEGQQRTLLVLSVLLSLGYRLPKNSAWLGDIVALIGKSRTPSNSDKLIKRDKYSVFYSEERSSVNMLIDELVTKLKNDNGYLSDNLVHYAGNFLPDAYRDRFVELLKYVDSYLCAICNDNDLEEFLQYFLYGTCVEVREFESKEDAKDSFLRLNTLGLALTATENRIGRLFSNDKYDLDTIENRELRQKMFYLESCFDGGLGSDPLAEVEMYTCAFLYAKYVDSKIRTNQKRLQKDVLMDESFAVMEREGINPISEMYDFIETMFEILDLENNDYSLHCKESLSLLGLCARSNLWKSVITVYSKIFDKACFEEFVVLFEDLTGLYTLFRMNTSLYADRCNELIAMIVLWEGTALEFMGYMQSLYRDIKRSIGGLKNSLAQPTKDKDCIVYGHLKFEQLKGLNIYETFKGLKSNDLKQCTYIKYPNENKESALSELEWGKKTYEKVLASCYRRLGTYFVGLSSIAKTSLYNGVMKNDNALAFNSLKEKCKYAFKKHTPNMCSDLFDGNTEFSSKMLKRHCENVESLLVQHFEKERG